MLNTNILRKIAGSIPNPGKSAIDTFLGISQGMIKKDSKELLGYKVSGKGYGGRVQLLCKPTNVYELLYIAWVYRIMNAR